MGGLRNINRDDISLYPSELTRQTYETKIYITEGEKAADALTKLGFAATTYIGGASKWREHYTSLLMDKEVVLVPDCDKPGIKGMSAIQKSFLNRGKKVQWLIPFPQNEMWA